MRYEFRRWLDTIDIKNLVFMDETGVNLAMTRNYGRCQGGGRVYYNRPGNKGKNLTLIGAIVISNKKETLLSAVGTDEFI